MKFCCKCNPLYNAVPTPLTHTRPPTHTRPRTHTTLGGFAVVFVVRASNGRKLALKRLAVNNDADLYLTKQEIAVTKALSDCSYSVTYISSITKQISSDVHEVLILMELYTGTP